MKRFDKKTRQKQLLGIALKHAVKVGYSNVTRKAIADEAGVAESLVSHMLGTMPKLKRKIVRAAIDKEELTVIAQAIVQGDSRTLKLSAVIREKALASLMGV